MIDFIFSPFRTLLRSSNARQSTSKRRRLKRDYRVHLLEDRAAPGIIFAFPLLTGLDSTLPTAGRRTARSDGASERQSTGSDNIADRDAEDRSQRMIRRNAARTRSLRQRRGHRASHQDRAESAAHTARPQRLDRAFMSNSIGDLLNVGIDRSLSEESRASTPSNGSPPVAAGLRVSSNVFGRGPRWTDQQALRRSVIKVLRHVMTPPLRNQRRGSVTRGLQRQAEPEVLVRQIQLLHPQRLPHTKQRQVRGIPLPPFKPPDPRPNRSPPECGPAPKTSRQIRDMPRF